MVPNGSAGKLLEWYEGDWLSGEGLAEAEPFLDRKGQNLASGGPASEDGLRNEFATGRIGGEHTIVGKDRRKSWVVVLLGERHLRHRRRQHPPFVTCTNMGEPGLVDRPCRTAFGRCACWRANGAA